MLFPMLTLDKIFSFTLAIDATKVAGCLQVNTKHKVTCDGTRPNHWISTQHLSKKDMLNIFRQDAAAKILPEIATEAKFCLLVTQNTPKQMYPFAVVACRPQSNNHASDFAHICCNTAKQTDDKHPHVNFTGLSTDGAPVESKDLIKIKLGFVDGKHD